MWHTPLPKQTTKPDGTPLHTPGELVNNLFHHQLTLVNSEECFLTILYHQHPINQIPGDIVECGTWRGGFAIFLVHMFPDKHLWVCDSFQGFQNTNDATYHYPNETHTPQLNESWNYVGPITTSLQNVQQNFASYNLTQSNIHFLKGFVQNSLNPLTCPIKQIALLRIDLDAYSPTRETLDALYPKVQPGGYIIFDDTPLIEAKDAIKDFFKQHNIKPELLHPLTNQPLKLDTNIDLPQGCYIIKTHN